MTSSLGTGTHVRLWPGARSHKRGLPGLDALNPAVHGRGCRTKQPPDPNAGPSGTGRTAHGQRCARSIRALSAVASALAGQPVSRGSGGWVCGCGRGGGRIRRPTSIAQRRVVAGSYADGRWVSGLHRRRTGCRAAPAAGTPVGPGASPARPEARPTGRREPRHGAGRMRLRSRRAGPLGVHCGCPTVRCRLCAAPVGVRCW
jgi:hypothetical protein